MVLVYLLLGWLLLSLPAAVVIGRSIHRGTSVPGRAVPRQEARGAADDRIGSGAPAAAVRGCFAPRTLTT